MQITVTHYTSKLKPLAQILRTNCNHERKQPQLENYFRAQTTNYEHRKNQPLRFVNHAHSIMSPKKRYNSSQPTSAVLNRRRAHHTPQTLRVFKHNLLDHTHDIFIEQRTQAKHITMAIVRDKSLTASTRKAELDQARRVGRLS